MSYNILAFAGRKNSGKSTLCNFLHGYYLKMYGVIDEFQIAENGDLIVETIVVNNDGDLSKGSGIIDVKRTDVEFAMWANSSMWPIVKHFAFATPIKEMAIDLLGLDRSLVYGSDDNKNTLTSYSWANMPFKNKNSGFMTIREILQVLGTEIFRKMNDTIWVDRTMNDIKYSNSTLTTISDLRYQNEFDAVKANGGKTIFLTGGKDGDGHSSENSFDGMTFDATLDTESLTVDETCHKLIDLLNEWGWIPEKIVIEDHTEVKVRDKGVRKIK